MMLFKLSARNLRKSMRDYMIYFATLILGVAIFYVFNAIGSQTVMMKMSKSTAEVIQLMNQVLPVISVFVSFVLGFLIVYASNFLMKRRKKEFGVYMLLGMGKREISTILLIETILIGMISLAAGLVLGVIASQGMSVIVANMFEADMTDFRFLVSGSAILKTIVYFIVMYLVVLVMNTIVVGKAKLIHLLHSGRKGERNVAKNPWICLVVFVISCVVLGTAYYNVTAGFSDLQSGKEVVIQIVKGIVSTFLIFWSLSGLILYLAKRAKGMYYKGLNSFTIKEFSSRVNTTVFSASIICLMLFMTICILSSAMSVKQSINENLKKMTPADVNFHMLVWGEEKYQSDSITKILEKSHVDTTMFQDVVDVYSYGDLQEEITLKTTLGTHAEKAKEDVVMASWIAARGPEEFMKVSDYNRVAKIYGLKTYTLNDDEYMIIADYEQIVNLRNKALELGTELTIAGKTYRPKYKACQDGFVIMGATASNFGIILLPDNTDFAHFQPAVNYYIANYHPTTANSLTKIQEYIDSDTFVQTINPKNMKHPTIEIDSKTQIYASSIGLTAMMIFIGLYLGIIFMISSAAIMALKELSEAADNREKYQILRKIGVDEKQINHSLLTQCALFFGLPLSIAIIHSVFGIKTCLNILENFGRTGLLYSILGTGGIIIAIYGGYFLITYYCSKKIIQ